MPRRGTCSSLCALAVACACTSSPSPETAEPETSGATSSTIEAERSEPEPESSTQPAEYEFGLPSGPRSKAVPRVRQLEAKIDGQIDAELVDRVVHSHLNELRACYNSGLTRDPELSGQIEVEFTITAQGTVGHAEPLDSDEVKDRQVLECAAAAVERWRFPEPVDGGEAVVVVPFSLERSVPGG